MSPLDIFSVIIVTLTGWLAGSRISWAIRSWPGHEEFRCDYLACPKCIGGLKRGCYNAGSRQDLFYTVFSAVFAGVSVYLWGVGSKALVSYVFAVSSMIIAVVDYRYYIIPDKLSINGIWVGLAWSAASFVLIHLGAPRPQFYTPLSDSILGAILGGGFLWLLGIIAWVLLKKEGMGGGDVKLLAAYGAWLGWKPVIGIIILASFLGSAGGILSIVYNRIRHKKPYQPLGHMIPFGPYLCIAFLFIFYFGMEPLYQILDIYQRWLEIRFSGM